MLFTAACVPGGGGGEADAQLDEQLAFATTTTIDEPARMQSNWRCGEVKQAVYTSIATLARYAASLQQGTIATSSADAETPDDDPLAEVSPLELRDALSAAAYGFTNDDQRALDAACELYGQHDAALELWEFGERGDACDVWRPAYTSAQEQRSAFNINTLHPLSSQLWVSATGSVAEGHGRCIAERAN